MSSPRRIQDVNTRMAVEDLYRRLRILREELSSINGSGRTQPPLVYTPQSVSVKELLSDGIITNYVTANAMNSGMLKLPGILMGGYTVTESDVEPVAPPPQKYDIWIDTSPVATGGDPVRYYWDGEQWVDWSTVGTFIHGDLIETGTIKAEKINVDDLIANTVEAGKITLPGVMIGAVSITVSDTEPVSPAKGDVWKNPTTGVLKYWDGTQWLQLSTLITGDLVQTASIKAENIDVAGLAADAAFIGDLTANTAFIDSLTASSAFITNLTTSNAFITNLVANTGYIQDLSTEIVTSKTIKLPGVLAGAFNITRSTAAPSAPQKYDVWIDTGTAGEPAYYWDGAQWISMGTLITSGLIKTNSIESRHIQASSIDASHIQANSITSSHIQADAIDATHIKANSITATEIDTQSLTADTGYVRDFTAQQITTKNLTVGRIAAFGGEDYRGSTAPTNPQDKDVWIDTSTSPPTPKVYDAATATWNDMSFFVAGEILAPATVHGNVISANSIDSSHISAGSINASHISAGSIGASHISAGSINASHISAGSIGASHISAGAISASHIASRTITGDRIAAGAITSYEIASRTITADRIVSGTITSNEIAAATITGTNIAAATITGDHIAAGTITASHLAAGSITANEVAAGSITGDRIASNTTIFVGNTASTHIIIDGSGTIPSISSSDYNRFVSGFKLEPNLGSFEAIEADNVSINTQIGSDTFVSGWAGSGWRIDNNAHIEADTLTVRNSLNVYELITNSVRGTDSSIAITDTSRINVSTVNSTTRDVVLTSVSEENIPFAVGDVVMAQKSGVRIRGTVSAVDNVSAPQTVTVNVDASDPLPNAGEDYTLVRIGSTSDTSRQGLIYLTSSDTYAPYIDVLDGIASASDWLASGKTKVRLGKLDGITYNTQSLTGYGLYGENAYLTGAIRQANGAWELNDDGSGSLASGNISWDSTGTLTIVGAGGVQPEDLGYADQSELDAAVAAGNTIISGGYINTAIIQAGSITADKINVSDLSALNATIGGWSISSSEIVSGKTHLNPEHGLIIDSMTASEAMQYYVTVPSAYYSISIDGTYVDPPPGFSSSKVISISPEKRGSYTYYRMAYQAFDGAYVGWLAEDGSYSSEVKTPVEIANADRVFHPTGCTRLTPQMEADPANNELITWCNRSYDYNKSDGMVCGIKITLVNPVTISDPATWADSMRPTISFSTQVDSASGLTGFAFIPLDDYSGPVYELYLPWKASFYDLYSADIQLPSFLVNEDFWVEPMITSRYCTYDLYWKSGTIYQGWDRTSNVRFGSRMYARYTYYKSPTGTSVKAFDIPSSMYGENPPAFVFPTSKSFDYLYGYQPNSEVVRNYWIDRFMMHDNNSSGGASGVSARGITQIPSYTIDLPYNTYVEVTIPWNGWERQPLEIIAERTDGGTRTRTYIYTGYHNSFSSSTSTSYTAPGTDPTTAYFMVYDVQNQIYRTDMYYPGKYIILPGQIYGSDSGHHKLVFNGKYRFRAYESNVRLTIRPYLIPPALLYSAYDYLMYWPMWNEDAYNVELNKGAIKFYASSTDPIVKTATTEDIITFDDYTYATIKDFFSFEGDGIIVERVRKQLNTNAPLPASVVAQGIVHDSEVPNRSSMAIGTSQVISLPSTPAPVTISSNGGYVNSSVTAYIEPYIVESSTSTPDVSTLKELRVSPKLDIIEKIPVGTFSPNPKSFSALDETYTYSFSITDGGNIKFGVIPEYNKSVQVDVYVDGVSKYSNSSGYAMAISVDVSSTDQTLDVTITNKYSGPNTILFTDPSFYTPGYSGISPYHLSYTDGANYVRILSEDLSLSFGKVFDETVEWRIVRDTSNNNLNFIYGGNIMGYLSPSTNVYQIDFTGVHYCAPDSTLRQALIASYKEHIVDTEDGGKLIGDPYADYKGMILVSTGEVRGFGGKEEIDVNEALPVVAVSDRKMDPRVIGVFSDFEYGKDIREYYTGTLVTAHEKDEDRVLVNSLGEGGILVCDENGPIRNGDYITTSSIPGYGMKQDDNVLRNYTVAKATQDCDFSDCKTIEFVNSNGEIIKARTAFIACTYHCG